MNKIISVIVFCLLIATILVQSYFISELTTIAEEQQEMVVTWREGHSELQEEHSQAVEKIEHLEYELEMSE